jgi:RNA polymerase sigma factor (TIGR02999 family)
MTDVTRLLDAAAAGDRQAAADLLPVVYGELRKLAAARMAAEGPGHTLAPTALVHEAYIRLVADNQVPHWKGRGHFFSVAAEAMRRILVDHARAKHADKRGGRWSRVELGDWHQAAQPPEQVVALSEAVDRLAAVEPQKAELVTLLSFGGLSMQEAADALGLSLRTAERWWLFARSWLYTELLDDTE